MSETFKIKSIIFNGKWANIDDESGKKFSVDSEKEPKIKDFKVGDELTGELKPWEKDGTTRYFFNFPKAAGAGKTFAPKDWTFEKRKAALEASVSLAASLNTSISKEQINSDQVLIIAEKFYTFLNQK